MKKKKKTPANNFNDENYFLKKAIPILTVLYYIFFCEKTALFDENQIKSKQLQLILYKRSMY